MKYDRNLMARYCAEFTGTAMLLCLGCMGCISNTAYPRNLLEMSINGGLVVMVAIHIFGFICGAYINPSVTLASFMLGLIPWQQPLAYFFLEMFGARFGFGLLAILVSKDDLNAGNGLCTTVPSSSINAGQAMGVEILLTSTLILFLCSLWDERNAELIDTISIKVGLFIACMSISGGYLSATSLNIARNQYFSLWIYIVAHMLSATLIPIAWIYVFSPNSKMASMGGGSIGD